MHLQQGMTGIHRVVSSPEKDCQNGKEFNNSVKVCLLGLGSGFGRWAGLPDVEPTWVPWSSLPIRPCHVKCTSPTTWDDAVSMSLLDGTGSFGCKKRWAHWTKLGSC